MPCQKSVQRRQRAFVRLDHVEPERRDGPSLPGSTLRQPASLRVSTVRAKGGGSSSRSTRPASSSSRSRSGQQVGGDAGQLGAQVTVSTGAADELSQDQQCPSLAEYIEALGDWAVLR